VIQSGVSQTPSPSTSETLPFPWRLTVQKHPFSSTITNSSHCKSKLSVQISYTVKRNCPCAHHEGIWEVWRYSSSHLNRGNRRRKVVRFTPQSLYPRRKHHRNPQKRKEVDSKTGLNALEITCPCYVQPVTQSLYRLSYAGSLRSVWLHTLHILSVSLPAGTKKQAC
jgi:hypothetical protein